MRVAVAVLLALTNSAFAQGITEQQAQEILKELRTIRQTLERQQQVPAQRPAAPAAQDEAVTLAFEPGGYSLGRTNAPLVMVEYTDYQCPFCRQFHLAAFDEIRKNYVDTGKLRYVSRDFPLDFHENANRAAVAARCAGEQGRFWELRHVLIVNASQLKADNIVTYAKDLKLDVDSFRVCLDSDRYHAEVARDMAEGRSVGVSGTPSFVIGRLANGRLQGIRLVGAMPYAMFQSKLEEMLNQPGGK